MPPIGPVSGGHYTLGVRRRRTRFDGPNERELRLQRILCDGVLALHIIQQHLLERTFRRDLVWGPVEARLPLSKLPRTAMASISTSADAITGPADTTLAAIGSTTITAAVLSSRPFAANTAPFPSTAAVTAVTADYARSVHQRRQRPRLLHARIRLRARRRHLRADGPVAGGDRLRHQLVRSAKAVVRADSCCRRDDGLSGRVPGALPHDERLRLLLLGGGESSCMRRLHGQQVLPQDRASIGRKQRSDLRHQGYELRLALGMGRLGALYRWAEGL